MARKYQINFESVPPLGTTIEIKHRDGVKLYTLVEAVPYRRKLTGDPSFVLHWECAGHRYKSGLRSNLQRVKLLFALDDESRALIG